MKNITNRMYNQYLPGSLISKIISDEVERNSKYDINYGTWNILNRNLNEVKYCLRLDDEKYN